MNIVLLGGPGSGKGTQAERLHSALGLIHVASGDLFRDNMNRNTPLGEAAREYMNRGDLVPDEVTIEMLRDRLSEADVEVGLVLDGFPRTLPQARALERMLEETGQRLDGVLHVKVPDETIVERLSGRLVCRKCPATFHRLFNPFAECPQGLCHGEHLYQREDDRPETVRSRLATYHTQTEPLIDYYEARGLLATVDGVGEVAQVTERCVAALEELQVSDRAGKEA